MMLVEVLGTPTRIFQPFRACGGLVEYSDWLHRKETWLLTVNATVSFQDIGIFLVVEGTTLTLFFIWREEPYLRPGLVIGQVVRSGNFGYRFRIVSSQ